MKRADIYLTITIDTEADHSPDWTKSNPLTFKSVIESIPDVLQPLFKNYGAIATYLLAVEVLENDEAVSIIKNLADCELGAHLHPEYIEPAKKYFKYAGTYSRDFSNNYDPAIERQKLFNLTKLFEDKIGSRPRVYRGGKFALGEATIESLMSLGYLVDTSVTPLVSWKNIGGRDFRIFPGQPYVIKKNAGAGKLVEVPVSIAFLAPLSRILNRPTWLRPSFSDYDQMRRLIDKFIVRYGNDNRDNIVLNMMFHSMEFCLGASPYSKGGKDLDRLLKNLESTIEYCQRIGVKFCKLSDTAKMAE